MKFPRLRTEWMVGSLVGMISGYYIFNDILKDYASKQRSNAGTGNVTAQIKNDKP